MKKKKKKRKTGVRIGVVYFLGSWRDFLFNIYFSLHRICLFLTGL